MNTDTETPISKKDRDKKDVVLIANIMFAMFMFYSISLACYFSILQFFKNGFSYDYYKDLPYYILISHQNVFIVILSFVLVYSIERHLQHSNTRAVYTKVITLITAIISSAPHVIILVFQFFYSDKIDISIHLFIIMSSFPLYMISIPLSAVLIFSTRNVMLYRLTLCGWSVSMLFGLLFLNLLIEWSYSE